MEGLQEIRMEDIEDRVILLSIAQTYKPYMDGDENTIYDIAKQSWEVGSSWESRDLAKYALAIYQNTVKGVFTINKWKKYKFEPGKWEFDGEIAPEEIRNRYLNKKITMAFGDGPRAYRYLNCNPLS